MFQAFSDRSTSHCLFTDGDERNAACFSECIMYLRCYMFYFLFFFICLELMPFYVFVCPVFLEMKAKMF